MYLGILTLTTKNLRVLFASISIILLLGVASPSFADPRLPENECDCERPSSANSSFADQRMGFIRMQIFRNLRTSINDIDFKDKSDEFKSSRFDTDATTGYLFDWHLKTRNSARPGGLSHYHGVAFEFYETSEQESKNRLKLDNYFIGYRYYFFGLYAGVNLALFSKATFIDPDGVVYPVSFKRRPVAYTLGYSYTFPFGLILGVHYLDILPTDYQFRDPSRLNIEDLTVRMFGVAFSFQR